MRALPEDLEKRFQVKMKRKSAYAPHFNIAPGQEIPVITEEKPDEIIWMRWGMMPKWWKQKSRGLINIRSESAFTKPVFKKMALTQRCIIPADGFYEWKAHGKIKVPYYFSLKNDGLFAFAGLFSEDQNGLSLAILTTEPNSLVNKIHNRMPCMLKKQDERLWLNRAPSRVLRPNRPTSSDNELQKLLTAYPAGEMKAYEVSREVNVPASEGDQLIRAV